MKTQTNGRSPVRQASYRLPIERRAVVAAGMVEHNGGRNGRPPACAASTRPMSA